MMVIQRAYRTELNPQEAQRSLFLQHAGAARWAYNWGLATKQAAFEASGESPSAIELHRILNAHKAKDYPWLYRVSKCAPQEALRDLDRAFKNFFAGRARFPLFKSRRRSGIGSFRLTGSITVDDRHIRLPRLGRIRLKERGYLPVDGTLGFHILSATVSERAGGWFVSLQVEQQIELPVNHGPMAGMDLGISRLATVSDGSVFENPKSLNRCLGKLRRLQRSVSRKRLGSRNRWKAKRLLARHHLKISNVRRDAIHKATTAQVKSKSVLVVEDLDCLGMLRHGDRNLSRNLADASLGEFLRQVDYKSRWYGCRVVKADPYFPSTRRCSVCGYIKPEALPLSQRTFECERCGAVLDRDLNSARNLASIVDPSCGETVNACESREVAAPVLGAERCPAMKQEPSLGS